MFAVELMNADIGTRKFMYSSADYGGSLITTQFVGGALHKVVRWAFEKQGLYQTPESQSPQDQEGDPEAVDIFIDDVADRKGEYDSTNDWHSARNAVWVRRAADGNPHDENPHLARKNYVYVNVANRGSDRTLRPVAEVDVFVATGQATETWEAPHSQASAPWAKLEHSAGAITSAAIPPGQRVRFGPFEWTPQVGGVYAILVRATTAGDRSNIDDKTAAACGPGPIPIQELVPFDNNLGYRLWQM